MNNPKAFPTYYYQQEQDGMDLRDYFAAHAIQGMFAGGDTEHLDISEIAHWAYKYADGMMKAREQ